MNEWRDIETGDRVTGLRELGCWLLYLVNVLILFGLFFLFVIGLLWLTTAE